MKGIVLEVKGPWAQFKRPETSNNPLTHDFITKTALIGMIGAVLGIDRPLMKERFPQLSEDLLYGVHVAGDVKKESWAFTMRSLSHLFEKAPKQMEFLRDPVFHVAIGLAKDRSGDLFDRFVKAVEYQEAQYDPVLGLHNCPATLTLLGKGEFEKREGCFSTQSFVPVSMKPQLADFSEAGLSLRLGFDRVPTFQNNDFWNLPDKYVDVVYCSGGAKIKVDNGVHHQFSDGNAWVLI